MSTNRLTFETLQLCGEMGYHGEALTIREILVNKYLPSVGAIRGLGLLGNRSRCNTAMGCAASEEIDAQTREPTDGELTSKTNNRKKP